MKNNIKALQLVEFGLSSKTVSKLTESQINVLHSRLLMSEAVKQMPAKPSYLVDKQGGELPPNPKGYEININTDGTATATAKESEIKEDDFELDSDQAYTGQQGSHDEYQSADDGMDDDTSPENHNKKMVGMTEGKKRKNKKNPWAICTAQLGDEFGTTERSEWSKRQMKKYERCVMDVKKSLKEGKNPVSLFLENQIMKIVEKNLPPRITKNELIKYLVESEPATAPTKPKTPTKPKPRPKPGGPGQNPFPGEKESPRAEEAKKSIIKSIINFIKNA